MRSQKFKNTKKERIFYKSDSATSKLLEVIEFLVGLHYIAFSRKTLGAKLRMDPFWEGHKIIKTLENLVKTLENLERGNFIRRVSSNNYKLTPKGIRRINFSKLFNLSLKKKKKDGFLRIIIFDIPEERKKERELLRNKLREFDFAMLQKSVFVSSYVCEREIKELCKILNLQKEVKILLAKEIKEV